VIKTDVEFDRMLAQLDQLQSRAGRLSPEEDALFDLIAALVEQYDERRYAAGPATALRMLKGFMESRGLQPRDLWPVLGSKAAVSHVLNGTREITKTQAKKLGQFFGVEYQLFL
jgi:HTH-type transcriptional regulator/antitoxin HigA